MKLQPFLIEEYYARYEFNARYMLSSSDCESRTIADLLALESGASEHLHSLWCGYTESPGAPWLREAITGLYEQVSANDVLVASCAEEGIFLFYNALIQAGDHVIVETPCYGSALELARGTGADVSEWKRRFEDGWEHDFDQLESLVRPSTRALYINTPHNPTGTHMSRAAFDRVVSFARAHNLILFSDEVYRELEHNASDLLPAAADLYERAISLGSISKTYGLPGLRLGWLVTHSDELREKMLALKHYTTICSSAPSEFLVALALRNRGVLVERNLELVARNLPLLASFFDHHSNLFEWVLPTASPIGFPRLRNAENADDFCRRVVEGVSVLLLPGSVYGEPAHIRFGFGRANMPEALEKLEEYLTH